jgi:hypothetical protein
VCDFNTSGNFENVESPLEERCNTLQREVRILEGEQTALKIQNAKLRQTRLALIDLAKQKTKEIRTWTKYAEFLEDKVKKLQHQLQELPGQHIDSITRNIKQDSDVGTIPSAQNDNISRQPIQPVEALHIRPSQSFNGAPRPLPGAETDPEADVIPQRRAISTPLLPHSDESTQSLGEDEFRPSQVPREVTIKEEPSSPEPVVVSARPVKRRRFDRPSPGPSKPPIHVKTEDSGSDPVITSAASCLRAQSSIDLDEGSSDLRTPKRRRVVPISPNFLENLNDGGIPLSLAHNRDGDIMTDIAALRHGTNAKSNFHRTPLQPVSSNRKLPVVASMQSLPGKNIATASAVSILDDGMGKSDPVESKRQFPEGKSSASEATYATPTSRSPLKRLLNSAISERTPILARRTDPRKNRGAAPTPDLAPPKRLSLPVGKLFTSPTELDARMLPRGPKPATSNPLTIQNSAAASKDGRNVQRGKRSFNATPLRLRPISSLNSSDFKINPERNLGENVAYDEVVRNKAERRDLDGCVDPQCCGKDWLALATSEKTALGPALLTTTESIKLMEEYLGDDAHLLGSMSKDEKEDLWMKAKIRELGNKFGKHRHRFEPAKSPLGFWDTTFPSTQEEQRERAAAQRIEREKVEARYREAMRTGGRWIFRDE